MERDLALLRWSLRVIGEATRAVPQEVETVEGLVRPGQVELLVVDEADRLKPQALEVLRDVYDRSPLGVILVGMPGLEKRLARYPQLYSRVGFVHPYRTLDRGEQQDLLVQQVGQWKSARGAKRSIEKEALAQIVRMTGGNFRQMERLLTQMKRILGLNPEVEQVDKEVVEAAREHLVFGKGIVSASVPGQCVDCFSWEKTRMVVPSQKDRGSDTGVALLWALSQFTKEGAGWAKKRRGWKAARQSPKRNAGSGPGSVGANPANANGFRHSRGGASVGTGRSRCRSVGDGAEIASRRGYGSHQTRGASVAPLAEAGEKKGECRVDRDTNGEGLLPLRVLSFAEEGGERRGTRRIEEEEAKKDGAGILWATGSL